MDALSERHESTYHESRAECGFGPESVGDGDDRARIGEC